MSNETQIIEWFSNPAESLQSGMPASDPRLIVPNGDDAAAFALDPGEVAVVTTDTLVEGVHFDLRYTPLLSLGRKLLTVSLSDLAAMGAAPRYALISVSTPEDRVASLEAIAKGARQIAASFEVRIIGGNVTATRGPLVLTSTLIGACRANKVVRRDAGVPGDLLCVTGTIGDARAGFLLASEAGQIPSQSEAAAAVFRALVDPIPQVAAGLRLAAIAEVHAMCDLSDGLARDVTRLLNGRSGQLGVRIHLDQLPISNALRAIETLPVSAQEVALIGGEDYQLLFLLEPNALGAVQAALRTVDVAVTAIGVVDDSGAARVVDSQGAARTLPGGFEHFKN